MTGWWWNEWLLWLTVRCYIWQAAVIKMLSKAKEWLVTCRICAEMLLRGNANITLIFTILLCELPKHSNTTYKKAALYLCSQVINVQGISYLRFHIKKFHGHAKKHKNHKTFLPRNFYGIQYTFHCMNIEYVLWWYCHIISVIMCYW